jgi:hypothetical protein
MSESMLVRLLFILVTLGLWICALVSALAKRAKISGWERGSGVVVDNHCRYSDATASDSASVRLYSPVIEFRHLGKKHQIVGRLERGKPWPTGTSLRIVFPGNTPNDGEAAYIGSLYRMPMALLAGSIFSVIAVIAISLVAQQGDY